MSDLRLDRRNFGGSVSRFFFSDKDQVNPVILMYVLLIQSWLHL